MQELIPCQSRYLVSPTPVALITTRDGDKTNVATVGNYMILSKDPVLIGVPIAPKRHTFSLIQKNKEFVINIPHQGMEEVVKYCGSVSGKEINKVDELGLELEASKSITTNGLKDCIGRLECELYHEVTLGSHTLFVGEVKSAWACEESFAETWKFAEKSPLLFDFKNYLSINEVSSNRKKLYEDMVWTDIKEMLEENKDLTAIIPIGSIEQHGYGLPLKTDSYLVTEVARRAAIKTNDLVLPTVYYGYNEKELKFPGTVSVKAKTLINYLEDICLSLIKVGFKKIVLINGHGWNGPIVKLVGHLVNENEGVTCATLDYWNLCSSMIKEVRQATDFGGMAHACEFETSLMLALDDTCVTKERLSKEISYKNIDDLVWHDLFIKSPIHIAQKFEELSESGVIGDPTVATKEKGEIILSELVAKFETFLGKFKEF
ncbi:creatininase family protein [Alkaliphilus hydrothermalis]|uniref:Creatinine amidohydrolase/Fe(II)-dependent formamide hydrolase-like protein/flavin reductase (DIM6/NTAB) family NADH-FMN oxidoreductase RutF n=1 Tax=Alkaliphilus hydrothermalis TaxID=1482730 RepID=A0ABS2NTW2_9FIRM|nr:creatininase family protein [Alkaliphilus hydrothermalis]MBM7616217.1 creatinine amidohydrolase/Fe(II)-dependent formamide hydrolase-like protein/flavin reductase (DIM6/NTAB) family NADH-FMN oxidoreductase RutF [Alkaliphilus hydrothermalis]